MSIQCPRVRCTPHAPIPVKNPCLTDVLVPDLQFSLLAAPLLVEIK